MNITKINVVRVVMALLAGVISILCSFTILIVFEADAEHAIPESERKIESQFLQIVLLKMAGQTISYDRFLGKTVCVIVDQNLDSLSEKQKELIKQKISLEHFNRDSEYWYLSVFYDGNKELYKYSRKIIPVSGSNVCADNGSLTVSVRRTDNAGVEFTFSDGGI